MSTEIEVNNFLLYDIFILEWKFCYFFLLLKAFNLQSKTSKDFLTSFSNFY